MTCARIASITCAVVLALSLVAVPVLARSAAAQSTTREQSVIAALKEFEAAILAGDTVTLKRIWTDDYTFVNGQGTIVTRAQRLANFASGATTVIRAINQREITVRLAGDQAVVQQLFTLRGRYSGVDLDTEVRGTFIWIWRAGRWQMAANQITPVLP